MKDTLENRKAVNAIIDTARIKDTGYQVSTSDYDGHFYLCIRQPKDTDRVAYPEIFCKDNWYGEKALGFEIATTGYGDHSIAQAQRAVAGLQIAIDLVEALLTTAELYGLKTRR
jgi:hypothetical protein